MHLTASQQALLRRIVKAGRQGYRLQGHAEANSLRVLTAGIAGLAKRLVGRPFRCRATAKGWRLVRQWDGLDDE